MKDLAKEKDVDRNEKDSDPLYVRGYCRVCNRHYFYRHQLDIEHIQFHQHHRGVCQKCGYSCARIKPKVGAYP